MDRRTLVVGLLLGVALTACLAAIDYQTEPPRYVHEYISYGEFIVLDTQTGTVNYNDADTMTSLIFPFQCD